jgi:glyoxylate carboligase
MTSYANDVLADDFSAMGTMCFLVDGKRYVFNVRFVSETVYTGITEHHSVPHTSLSVVYDLQGRKVVKTQRGLYIQNGRKYMVK